MLFSRTVGMKEWLCPNCNHLNRSRVNAINGWKVQCRDSHCQRVYIVGEVFYEPCAGLQNPSCRSHHAIRDQRPEMTFG
jgi:hypothetical protein